ncbi:MAG: hypothetical protein ACRDP6_32790 [Actinoallomurus sp.]
MTNPNEADRRAAYTAGLRRLADIIDNHPEVPLPVDGSDPKYLRMSFHFLSEDDPRAAMAATRRALGVPMEKDDSVSNYFSLKGNLAGLYFTLTAFRKDVCERVVVATREVEVEEADPAAVAALPKVKRTEVIEDVEWRCTPLLAAGEHDKAVAGR